MKKFLLFIFFLAAGVAGSLPWPALPQSVGYYKISANQYGVAIYQDGLHNTVQFTGATSFQTNGSTITIPDTTSVLYGRDDIIFDVTSVYTDAPQEQIYYLQKTKTDKTLLPITFYLVNPRVPGVLEFYGNNMQIDKNKKQITGTINKIVVLDSI